jgi:hydrogenase nickel incorporation protein HypA/HybF
LITEVEQVAISHRAVRVEAVKLQIGPLSGVEIPLLQHAYPFASADTLAEGSMLKIEPTSLKVYCKECSSETEAKPNLLICGVCKSCLTQVVSGEELILMSIELITAGVS